MANSEGQKLVTKEQIKEHLKSNLPAGDDIQRLIDDADAEVVRRYGPHVINGPVTELLSGGSFRLFPERPVAEVIEATEMIGGLSKVLAPDDYQLWYGGRMVERLSSGTNPQALWGDSVELSFTPVDDDAQRRMAIIRLVQLGLQYSGLQSESVGPYSAQNLDYPKERDAILKQLSTGVPI